MWAVAWWGLWGACATICCCSVANGTPAGLVMPLQLCTAAQTLALKAVRGAWVTVFAIFTFCIIVTLVGLCCRRCAPNHKYILAHACVIAIDTMQIKWYYYHCNGGVGVVGGQPNSEAKVAKKFKKQN